MRIPSVCEVCHIGRAMVYHSRRIDGGRLVVQYRRCDVCSDKSKVLRKSDFALSGTAKVELRQWGAMIEASAIHKPESGT
jgi:ribosomal protein S14